MGDMGGWGYATARLLQQSVVPIGTTRVVDVASAQREPCRTCAPQARPRRAAGASKKRNKQKKNAGAQKNKWLPMDTPTHRRHVKKRSVGAQEHSYR